MTDLLHGLTPKIRSEVINEAKRLLSLLPSCVEVDRAKQQVGLLLQNEGNIGEKQRVAIDDYPLAAMLLRGPKPNFPRVEELNWFRAWVMIATLNFCAEKKQTDTFSRVRNGLRVVRRVVHQRYSVNVIHELPSFTNELRSLKDALRFLNTRLVLRDDRLVDRFQELSNLLIDAIVPRAPFERSRQAPVQSPEIIPDDIEVQKEGVRIIFENPLGESSGREEQAEERHVKQYDFQVVATQNQWSIASEQVQLKLFELDAAERGWVGDFAALSPHECKFVWARARDQIGRVPGAALALATMAFSGFPSDIKNGSLKPGSRCWNVHAGWLEFSPDVTGQCEKETNKNKIFMKVDERLAEVISRELVCEEPDDLLKKWLRTVGAARNIQIDHLKRALPDALFAEKADRAIIGILSGKKCHDCIQMFYSKISVSRISDVWVKTIHDSFGSCDGFEIFSDVKQFGSLLCPTKLLVQRYFRSLRDTVVDARAVHDIGVHKIITTVAAELNFTSAVLSLLTARRPHRDAFEPLGRIVGQKRPILRMVGKGNRLMDDGRWVPVTQTMKNAFQFWNARLQRIKKSGVLAVNHNLARHIAEIERGVISPFFSWEAIAAQPVTLSASEFWRRAGTPNLTGGQRVAPHNWVRHYMRSALVEKGVPGAYIDAFMGHTGWRGDPMSLTSAWSHSAFDVLGDAIDQIWADLKVDFPVIEP